MKRVTMRNRTNTMVVLTGLAVATVGCTDRVATDPAEAEAITGVSVPNASIVVAADLDGSWEWRNVEKIRLPAHLAPMLGIAPEGPNTHAICESAGTLTITAVGDGFEGVAAKTFNLCRTKGGQTFQQPASVLFVKDGRVHGNAVDFSFESPTVGPCPHHAVATREGGLVIRLSGTGHCILPGHPQSESPIDLPPPPGGTSTTLSWVAERS